MAENTSQEAAKQARSRRIGVILAYTLIAIPSAYGGLQGLRGASRETVAKVHADKSEEVAKLQAWVKFLRADLERAERDSVKRFDRLRAEVADSRKELTRAILQLASRRRVPSPAREALAERATKPIPLPRKARTAKRLPKLEPPARTLDAVESRVEQRKMAF